MPLPLTKGAKRSLGVSKKDLQIIQDRVNDGVCIVGLRFSNDGMSPRERFDRLEQEFGDGFIGVEIDSSPGNAHRFSTRAHSVLTEEVIEEPGHPTQDALNLVLEHFKERLVL